MASEDGIRRAILLRIKPQLPRDVIDYLILPYAQLRRPVFDEFHLPYFGTDFAGYIAGMQGSVESTIVRKMQNVLDGVPKAQRDRAFDALWKLPWKVIPYTCPYTWNAEHRYRISDSNHGTLSHLMLGVKVTAQIDLNELGSSGICVSLHPGVTWISL